MQAIHPISVPRTLSAGAVLNRAREGLTWLGSFSRGAQCAREAGRLSQLSDSKLAALGIARKDIVRHAFRGHLFM